MSIAQLGVFGSIQVEKVQ